MLTRNGFFKVSDPDVFKYLNDIESWEWKNLQGLRLIKRNANIEEALVLTQRLIGDKYVSKIDPEYKLGGDCEIVNGMDDATLSWHNDNIEGYNLSALLYWDSMDEDIGGMIKFRDISTKELTGQFFPQKYDVSFMNHGSGFEHIVTPLKLSMNRRVVTFNYNINDAIINDPLNQSLVLL